MANTSPDDVALLKQELAQFLLAEITSAGGAQAFRKEVGDQVGAVIDRILNERLDPALAAMQRQAAEQMRVLTERVERALRRVEDQAPAGPSPETDRQLADLTARLDDMRQRLAKVEEAKPRATAQPLRPPETKQSETRLADERLAVAPASTSSLPRWALWLLLLLLALSVLGLGNLYYERLMAPDAVASPPPVFVAPAPSAQPPATHVSVPPQTPATMPTMTPTPAPAPQTAPPVITPPPAVLPKPTPPQQHARAIPADFAIERGWLAAQPYAVEPRLARRVGTAGSLPTLKSVVCGRAGNCTSDALMSPGSEAKQLIALQMLMSQIGDRFCAPRRSVDVTGQVSAEGLADLAAIAKCAGGAAYPCRETDNRVCPPDSDSLQAGLPAARAALLRWALWKTGST
ncbi:MAG: hypothetical protein WDN03_02350 [Rhizomicrobium sp.]